MQDNTRTVDYRGLMLKGLEEAKASGTIWQIPEEPLANDPSGIATWRNASFIVDLGEVDLRRVPR